ncbi:MAG: hypothetical protein GX821_00480 [Clostridiaceae bacterium]|nr:AEC family transporter [Clostridiales bacterium]MDD2441913.1 AEC family transporter [Eubacteriales bacterium]MDD4140960.1 AEC family transporter [Eubacteriales bacterium]MDD4744343.1 AEC family transporter [Eubacteriales bacterium]NLB43617.1 hypothetical protein [Clostridiaceae bacterium]
MPSLCPAGRPAVQLTARGEACRIEPLSVTALQLVTFFSLFAAGYLLRRSARLPDQTGLVLSRLEVLLFLPALCFNTMAKNFQAQVFRDQGPMILTGFLVVAVTYGAARLLAGRFTRDPITRDVYVYSFTVPNLGYLGYPLVLALFGETTLFRYMVYAIPYQLFIYTVGIYILNPARTFTFKSILNPSMAALFAGIVVGLLRIPLPEVVTDTLNLAAQCMAPVAMLLTGFVLGAFTPGKLLSGLKSHIAAWIRLAVIPLAALAVFRLAGADPETTLLAVLLLAMPFGLNGVIFPQAHGKDSTEGAQICFVSHLYSLISLPLMIALLLAVLDWPG